MGTVKGIRRPTERAQQLRREPTPAERRLWRALSNKQLGVRFSRQMPVGPYICDFLSRGSMLVVEVDGDTHAQTAGHDARRDAFVRSKGLRILRFANADVMGNLEGVVATIADALTASPPPTPPASGRGVET